MLRDERKDHLVITGGPLNVNPFLLKDVLDIAFIGDAEKSLVEFLDIYSSLEDPKADRGVFKDRRYLHS